MAQSVDLDLEGSYSGGTSESSHSSSSSGSSSAVSIESLSIQGRNQAVNTHSRLVVVRRSSRASIISSSASSSRTATPELFEVPQDTSLRSTSSSSSTSSDVSTQSVIMGPQETSDAAMFDSLAGGDSVPPSPSRSFDHSSGSYISTRSQEILYTCEISTVPTIRLSSVYSERVRSLSPMPNHSLIIKLPLPESMGGPKSRPQPASVLAPDLPVYDHVFWTKHSQTLKMRNVMNALGLKGAGRSANSGKGKLQFNTTAVIQLDASVSVLARSLPKTLARLVNVAVDVTALSAGITDLLDRFGEDIWSRDIERSWLLQASDGVEGYGKDLVFEDASDRRMYVYCSLHHSLLLTYIHSIHHHLRIWTLLKAFNTARNSNYHAKNLLNEDGERKVANRNRGELEVTEAATLVTQPSPPANQTPKDPVLNLFLQTQTKATPSEVRVTGGDQPDPYVRTTPISKQTVPNLVEHTSTSESNNNSSEEVATQQTRTIRTVVSKYSGQTGSGSAVQTRKGNSKKHHKNLLRDYTLAPPGPHAYDRAKLLNTETIQQTVARPKVLSVSEFDDSELNTESSMNETSIEVAARHTVTLPSRSIGTPSLDDYWTRE